VIASASSVYHAFASATKPQRRATNNNDDDDDDSGNNKGGLEAGTNDAAH